MGLIYLDSRVAKKFFCCKDLRLANEKSIATGNIFEIWNDGRRDFLEVNYCPYCGKYIKKLEEELEGVVK